MRLPLMMRLVPRDQVQHIDQRQLALLEEFGDGSQVSVAETPERFQQMRPRFIEHLANQRRRRNIIVRLAPSSESRHEVRKSRLSPRNESLRGKQLLRNSDVH